MSLLSEQNLNCESEQKDNRHSEEDGIRKAVDNKSDFDGTGERCCVGERRRETHLSQITCDKAECRMLSNV